MSPHDFRNEDSQNRVRKPSRSPSRVRRAPGTRLWRQLGSTNENLPVRPSPVHEPIEHAAKQMRDSRPLPPRLAPCRTTAILRKTALKERGRRTGVVAGKDRTAPQQSQIPSGLVRCECTRETFARRLDNRAGRLSDSFRLAHRQCRSHCKPPAGPGAMWKFSPFH